MVECKGCGETLPEILKEQVEVIYTCSCGEKYKADCGDIEPVIDPKQERIYTLEQKLEESKLREERYIEEISDLKDLLLEKEHEQKILVGKLDLGEEIKKELHKEIEGLRRKCNE